MVNFEEIQKVIKNRRSVYPKSYLPKPIEKEVLLSLLECADQAPTHRLTQPWRYKVFTGAGLTRLADELVKQYKEITPAESFLQKKSVSIYEKVMQSGAVLAICMNVSGRVPEWEDLAAVACSVQNMWIAASTLKIGAYWSSPALIGNLNSFLKLEDNEKCVGLFYMGYHEEEARLGNRTPIEEKISWIEG